MVFGKRELNVVILGIIFMILFSGFFTLSNLEKILLTGIKDDNPSFTGGSFVSLSILYIVFAVSIWIVPSLLTVVSPKVTLIIGTLGYSVFTASFYTESAWFIYFGSFCNGVGAGLLWTAECHYMVLNSTPNTIQKDSAIFAILCQSAMIYGNIVVYFVFRNQTVIDSGVRTLVISILLGFSLVSFALALILPPPQQSISGVKTEKTDGLLVALKKAIILAKEKNMICLILSFIYMGFGITFLTGVYGPCIGFTLQLRNSKDLVPLNGFFAGIGEVLACFFLVMTSTKLTKWKYGGTVVMLIGLVSKLSAISLIYLNIPNNALLGDTMDTSYIKPSATIALLCSMLLGVTDGTFLTMCLAVIGTLYANDSAQAVSIYIFFMSLGAAVSFFYSMYLSLHVQLLILTIAATIGTLSYSYVSQKHYENELQSSQSPLTYKM